MRTSRKFRCRGSLWNEVKKSSLGNAYITIVRPVSLSALRQQGVFVSAIDVPREEIPEKYRNLLVGRKK